MPTALRAGAVTVEPGQRGCQPPSTAVNCDRCTRVSGFAEALGALMHERGLSANALARQVPCDKALISRYRSGRQDPSARMARRIDEVLGADGRLAGLAAVPAKPEATPGEELADEIGALEL